MTDTPSKQKFIQRVSAAAHKIQNRTANIQNPPVVKRHSDQHSKGAHNGQKTND
jgi:hypothetical protein